MGGAKKVIQPVAKAVTTVGKAGQAVGGAVGKPIGMEKELGTVGKFAAYTALTGGAGVGLGTGVAIGVGGGLLAEKLAGGKIPEQGSPEFEQSSLADQMKYKIAAEYAKTTQQLQQSEQQASERVKEQTTRGISSVEALLQSRLQEAGFQAGETRREAGSQFAQRGLGRSSLSVEKMGEIGLAEVEAKGQARMAAEQQVKSLKAEQAKAIQGISDERFSIQERLSAMELRGLTDVAFQEKTQALKSQFNRYIADLKLEAQHSQDMMDLYSNLGSVTGKVAGLYFGSKSGEEE